ncbi:MAG: hypothetical protein JWP13_107 [Candidatus Saccharibacteria bacterium]|nr:hypothetical protein [Candidatus Saccharibacteria bacterium]
MEPQTVNLSVPNNVGHRAKNIFWRKLVPHLRNYVTWDNWQMFYVLTSISWLLGPSLNRHLSTATSFISTYEELGNPWSLMFRSFDLIAALALLSALYVAAQHKHSTIPHLKATIILLSIFAIGSALDILLPSGCHGLPIECIVPDSLSHDLHFFESMITAAALFLANVMWAIRKDIWSRVVLLTQIILITMLIINQDSPHTEITVMQFAYQVIVILWIASKVPALAETHKPKRPPLRIPTIITVIGVWVFLSGFISIINAVFHIEEFSELSSAYFGDNTAWLSQQSVAVGIVLMYVSRHLWRGEYRAWQITSTLLWIEAIKYAVVTPNFYLVLLYGSTATLLLRFRSSFSRFTGSEKLAERLKKLGIVALAALIALILGIILLRLKHHPDFGRLRFNFVQFTRSLLLVRLTHFGPLPRRLVGQVLNIAGIVLLTTGLISLFKPKRPLIPAASLRERQKVLTHIYSYASSSEDYFKYWPTPKLYWWDKTKNVVIVYRVIENVAFALADPVAPSRSLKEKAMQDFLVYCRRHGWLSCFLMVNETQKSAYATNGYKLLRIGASAVVDTMSFESHTSRNKWWRWIRNKGIRQNWSYHLASPPHSPALLKELVQVSDQWLKHGGHVERGFALGYFDPEYLQQCRLHLLRDQSKVIAFANELPSFNLPTTTIDLMRYKPGATHAMSVLLYHTILQLSREGQKLKFDLGFVPLASPSGKTERFIKQIGQMLIREAISAKGLEQFKNKFDPAWENNYIAFDGDWVDVIRISRWLESLLRP